MVDPKKDEAWFDHSQPRCAPPPATIHRYYSKYLTKKLPSVAAFIHGFSIKYEDINSLVLQMMKSGGKGSAAAFDWVRRNRNSLTKLYPGK